MQQASLVERLSTTPVNQALSMISAGQAVAPEDISESDRKAHGQVMGMVSPSLFLRAPLGVLAAIGLSIIASPAHLPTALSNIASWTLVFALPAVSFSLWATLLYWRLRRAGIREMLSSRNGHLRLMYISLAGYSLATAVSAAGVLTFPKAFP